MLYLSKEEGGQGLVHLERRKGAFRLEFFKVIAHQFYHGRRLHKCLRSNWEFKPWYFVILADLF